VVWVQGEHDVATAANVSGSIAQAARLDDFDLVVDLSGITFMDASTIGAIVANHNRLLGRSHSLSVRAPSPLARRLLTTCDLAFLIDDFPAAPSRNHAAVTSQSRGSHARGGHSKEEERRPDMGGSTKKAKGRVKQAAGAITGDKKLKREGKADERVGNLQNKTEDAADAVHDKVDEVIEKVSRKK
jgi:anti-anti-sigma factor